MKPSQLAPRGVVGYLFPPAVWTAVLIATAIPLAFALRALSGYLNSFFIQAAGVENVAGRAFVTFGGVPPEQLTGKGADFVKKYKERYKAEPQAYAVYGYVAAKVALDAMALCLKKKHWPGPGGDREDAQNIELPEWAEKQIDDRIKYGVPT